MLGQKMYNLYGYLIDVKGYTPDESYETCLRLEAGMFIPIEVKKDISDFYNLEYKCY